MAANHMTLTEFKVERLRPDAQRYTVKDIGQPGLCLRVTPSGIKTWSFVYRSGRETKRFTIGRWPAWSVIKARQRTRDILRARDKGEDPATVKQEAKRAPMPSTVREAGDAWLEAICDKRSLRTDKQALHRDLYPSLGKRPMQDVTTPQIVALLDAAQNRARSHGAKGDAIVNRVRASLSSLWAWAEERGYCTENPVTKIKRRSLKSRDRVLTPDELKTLWKAWDSDAPYSVRMVSRLLLVTAQRLSEVACAEWREVDTDAALWTIPAARTKSERVHRLPLSNLALELLTKVKEKSADSNFWFPSRWGPRKGLHPISSNTISRYWSENSEPTWGVTNATAHDLRTSAATAMAELSVRREVISAVLNHAHGDITAVYIRAELIDQQRDALQKWADYLRELVGV